MRDNLNTNNISEKEKRWRIVSAYVDNELDDVGKYNVMKKIENDELYKQTYNEIKQLKGLISSVERKKASDSFNKVLMEKIEKGEQLRKVYTVLTFRKIVQRISLGVAAAAMFAFVLVFAIKIANTSPIEKAYTEMASGPSDSNAVGSIAVSDMSVTENEKVVAEDTTPTAVEEINEKRTIVKTTEPVILGPDEIQDILNMGKSNSPVKKLKDTKLDQKVITAAITQNIIDNLELGDKFIKEQREKYGDIFENKHIVNYSNNLSNTIITEAQKLSDTYDLNIEDQ